MWFAVLCSPTFHTVKFFIKKTMLMFHNETLRAATLRNLWFKAYHCLIKPYLKIPFYTSSHSSVN